METNPWDAFRNVHCLEFVLVKLGHYPGTLVSDYTGEEWVSITITEQVSVYQSISPRVSLDNFGLCELRGKQSIDEVPFIYSQPGLLNPDLHNLRRFLFENFTNSYSWYLQCFLDHRTMPSLWIWIDFPNLQLSWATLGSPRLPIAANLPFLNWPTWTVSLLRTFVL